MRVIVAHNPRELGEEAARLAAAVLRRAVKKEGSARLALATGASVLDALAALTKEDVPWERIELFQVCEYVGMAKNDPKSCRKALCDRFAKRVPLKAVYDLDGTEEGVRRMNELLSEKHADLVLLGMGKNGQVGFNAAPADFDARMPYLMNEEAVTMTVHEMMRSHNIIVCAPYAIHSENVWQVMTHSTTENLPATALKRHPKVDFLLDRESASQVSLNLMFRHNPQLTMYQVIEGEEETEE